MAELTESQRRNILQQQGLGTVRDNLYNFGKKSFQSAGPTLGAMFNSGQALFDTIMGDDENAIRNRNERDAYLRRRDAIQSGGLSSTPLSDSQIEGILTKDPNYNPNLDLYTDYVGGKFGNLGNVAESFLLGKGLKDTTEEESLQKFKTLERLNNNPNKYGEFSLLDNEVIDAEETASASRSDGQGFEDIYETITNRPIATQALKDEKTNLDAFPKLSIEDNEKLEKMQLEERRAAEKIDAEAGYEDGGDEAYKKELNYGELTDEAILDTAKSKGETVTPATREELLAKYKKEFYEATGLDPSGKADKSSALMAMGLALMQNKAGKGFNVGRMLSEVGRAGEKALPKLEAARKTAKAERVAAGKYALDRIQAGESASAALAKEARLYKKELYLKKLEFENEAAKAKAKGIEYKNVRSDDVVKDVPLSYGVVDGQSVLAKPLAESRGIVGAYNRYSHAQTILNDMENNLQNLSDADSPTLRKIVDRIKGIAVGLGITSASQAFGEKLISDETSTDNKRRLLINEYKRLLLQESQVSDLDLQTLKASFGEAGLFGNVEQQIDSLRNMKNYFSTQQDKTYEALLQMKQRELYTNQNEYNNTQKYISDNLDKTYTIIPLSQQSNTKSIATLDISKGG